MDYLAFTMKVFQTFQNVFRYPQDDIDRKPWGIETNLKIVAKHICDEANVLANETLKFRFMQEMDDVRESHG